MRTSNPITDALRRRLQDCPKAFDVLYLRYFEALTKQEIVDEIGLTRTELDRILQRITEESIVVKEWRNRSRFNSLNDGSEE